ncbi:MAG: metallophosphoesterase family protein [Clostridia bacterium]|nr:metallophosphoesterase family protein [Clostridia bacterium]
MKILKKMLITLLIIAAFVFLAFSINEKLNQKVFVTEYTFCHSELPTPFEGYRIMVISDLHEAPFSQQIIHHINVENPDIIVFTGDMVQLPDSSIEETKKIAAAAGDIPMYAVSGNHDTQCGDYDGVIAELWECGIRPLENDGTRIIKENEVMYLIGVKDPVHDVVTKEHTDQMCSAIEKNLPEEKNFAVLLCHRADLYPQIKDAGADLILSGHLHGGIIRLPFVGGLLGREVDEKHFFPEYDYGYIKEGNFAAMIVSGGCDKNSDKKRYFNPPEVVLITLEGE